MLPGRLIQTVKHAFLAAIAAYSMLLWGAFFMKRKFEFIRLPYNDMNEEIVQKNLCGVRDKRSAGDL
jgi:hypothetical protein